MIFREMPVNILPFLLSDDRKGALCQDAASSIGRKAACPILGWNSLNRKTLLYGSFLIDFMLSVFLALPLSQWNGQPTIIGFRVFPPRSYVFMKNSFRRLLLRFQPFFVRDTTITGISPPPGLWSRPFPPPSLKARPLCMDLFVVFFDPLLPGTLHAASTSL